MFLSFFFEMLFLKNLFYTYFMPKIKLSFSKCKARRRTLLTSGGKTRNSQCFISHCFYFILFRLLLTIHSELLLKIGRHGILPWHSNQVSAEVSYGYSEKQPYIFIYLAATLADAITTENMLIFICFCVKCTISGYKITGLISTNFFIVIHGPPSDYSKGLSR